MSYRWIGRLPLGIGAGSVMQYRVVVVVAGGHDASAAALVKIEHGRFAIALDFLAVAAAGIDLVDHGRPFLAAYPLPAAEIDQDLAGFLVQHLDDAGEALVLAPPPDRAGIAHVCKQGFLILATDVR